MQFFLQITRLYKVPNQIVWGSLHNLNSLIKIIYKCFGKKGEENILFYSCILFPELKKTPILFGDGEE